MITGHVWTKTFVCVYTRSLSFKLVLYLNLLNIDKVVVDASVKHLRGICGSSMDSYKGHNYEVGVK